MKSHKQAYNRRKLRGAHQIVRRFARAHAQFNRQIQRALQMCSLQAPEGSTIEGHVFYIKIMAEQFSRGSKINWA